MRGDLKSTRRGSAPVKATASAPSVRRSVASPSYQQTMEDFTGSYGIPYMGSKNTIAEELIKKLPSADYFVDLFGGGGAMTHAAILSGKYKHFIINDITDSAKMFVDATKGKFKGKRAWISRETFFARKDKDPYIRYCWSYGYKGTTYAYSKEIEPYKRALHYAIFEKDPKPFAKLKIRIPAKCLQGKTTRDRRLALKHYLQGIKHKFPAELQNIENLESLRNLERVQALSGLRADIKVYQGNYWNVKIPKNSVIYCDPPYRGTSDYLGMDFDFNKFDNWCRKQKANLFISEYHMPKDFKCIFKIQKRCTLAKDNKPLVATEKLFIPKN